jgi:hypothetical protein
MLVLDNGLGEAEVVEVRLHVTTTAVESVGTELAVRCERSEGGWLGANDTRCQLCMGGDDCHIIKMH